MTEAQIEREVCRRAFGLGITSSKLSAAGSRVGIPDRIFWVPGGVPVLAEFKRPGGRLSKVQKRFIAELLRLGYVVAVICSVDEGVGRLRARLALSGRTG